VKIQRRVQNSNNKNSKHLFDVNRDKMKAKPKYGINVWMAAGSSNGYNINFPVYLGGEGKNQRIHGLGYDVVVNMAHPFSNRNHHLEDNYTFVM